MTFETGALILWASIGASIILYAIISFLKLFGFKSLIIWTFKYGVKFFYDKFEVDECDIEKLADIIKNNNREVIIEDNMVYCVPAARLSSPACIMTRWRSASSPGTFKLTTSSINSLSSIHSISVIG